jgi:microcystin-dependent protein
MIFGQTAAPTGFTKLTNFDNYALRVVSGTASSGGSVAFTTAFASGLSAGATTLSTPQIPSHTHTITTSGQTSAAGCAPGYAFFQPASTGATGGGGSHNHTIPSLAVLYVDVIRASKD